MGKFKKKPFLAFMILWAGGFIAAIGNGLTSFGLGVFVYEQTGMASATTLITLLAFLPGLLLSPLAGVLADRYDRRLLMILGDGLSALGLLYILLCMINGEVQLWQICIGVTISSVFSSLVDPAFKATISDILPEKEYTKASGLVQVSGAARYLISPALAGILLRISNIRLLLMLDICTIFITVTATLVVRKGIRAKTKTSGVSLVQQFKSGLEALTEKKGVLLLTIMGSVITFCLGFLQTLSTPMMLAFTDSGTLGILTTISASGMLVSSIIIGILPPRLFQKRQINILSISFFIGGLLMIGFGIRENIVIISTCGFLLFATLPFANTVIDYLVRINIDNQLQGRVWGLINILSQLGYVMAYALAGPLADYIFKPMLMEDGFLANSVGKVVGIGSGRGVGLLIMVAGLLLAITAIVTYKLKSIRGLESE